MGRTGRSIAVVAGFATAMWLATRDWRVTLMTAAGMAVLISVALFVTRKR